jgi:hypothetical protein
MKSENGDRKRDEKVILSVPSMLCLNNDSLSEYKKIRIGEIFISLKKDIMETRISSFLNELIETHEPKLPLPHDIRESLNKFTFRLFFKFIIHEFILFYFYFSYSFVNYSILFLY